MRFGANKVRSAAVRYLPAMLAVAAATGVGLRFQAFADAFEFTPILSLQQFFTDNVRAASGDSNRDPDGVTVLSGTVKSLVNTSRVRIAGEATLSYEEFWATDSLDNVTANGFVAGRGEVIEDVWFIDGYAEKNDVYVSPTDGSVSGLEIGTGTLQLQSYNVSSMLVLNDLAGLVDFSARGGYAALHFDEPVVGIPPALLSDIEVKQVAGKITTGNRASRYEVFGTGEYLEADSGFELRNAVGGVFFHVTKGITAIGRFGYERISDPLFPMIRGNVWSLGAKYQTGHGASFVQFEYGRRFEDETYRGELSVQVTPRIRVLGTYRDALTPIQLTFLRDIDDLYDTDGNLSVPEPSKQALPDLLIPDTIVRDRDIILTGEYLLGLRTVTLRLQHSDRFFPLLADDEKYFAANLTIDEQLSRRLSYLVDVEFLDDYDAVLARPTTKSYTARLSVSYEYKDRFALTGGYATRIRTTPGSDDVYENVLRLGVSKTF